MNLGLDLGLAGHFGPDLVLDLLGERLWRRLVLAGAAAHVFGLLVCSGQPLFKLAAQIIA